MWKKLSALTAAGTAVWLASCSSSSSSSPGDSGATEGGPAEAGMDATTAADGSGDGGLGEAAAMGDSAAPMDASESDAAQDGPGDAGADGPAYVFDGGVSFTEYVLPADAGTPNPAGITLGPDGNMWFVEYFQNKVCRITPTGSVTEFPVTGGHPRGIAAGSDQALWFTAGSFAGRIAVDGGGMNTYAPDSGMYDWYWVTPGSDGNLWLSSDGPGAAARLTTAGTLSVFPLPPPDAGFYAVRGIGAGPGGVWMADDAENTLTRVSPAGALTVYEMPDAGPFLGPSFAAGGPDGKVWYSRRLASKVGRLDPDGSVEEFVLPATGQTVSSAALGGVVATGPDGNVWLTVLQNNALARVTPAGVVTEFTVPTKSAGLLGLAAGPGNTLWFTEYDVGKIGVATLY